MALVSVLVTLLIDKSNEYGGVPVNDNSIFIVSPGQTLTGLLIMVTVGAGISIIVADPFIHNSHCVFIVLALTVYTPFGLFGHDIGIPVPAVQVPTSRPSLHNIYSAPRLEPDNSTIMSVYGCASQ
ncbi:MAG: hypothetical protein BWY47_00835 [Bacteroidetes bacterium ADurb.Bin302]|nr:MAG: hypothetical protein BWY47_00835 [Bacteroidetes bacterium ADurb.Bin302]